MNTPIATTKTMTSLEIAELTGKQHKHVTRDIRKMVAQFEKAVDSNAQESGGPKLDRENLVGSNLSWHCVSDSYVDDRGKAQQMFRLDKETTLTLMSGYDVVLRHKVIQRWAKLEGERMEAEKLATDALHEPLLMFTQRSKQLANSKEVNSYNFSHGGKEEAIRYNRANCFHHTGKTPTELVEWAKRQGVPSRFRTSGKEVVRVFKPAVGASMALADDFCKTGRIGIDEAAMFCKAHALPIFEKMQQLGLLNPSATVKQLKAK